MYSNVITAIDKIHTIQIMFQQYRWEWTNTAANSRSSDDNRSPMVVDPTMWEHMSKESTAVCWKEHMLPGCPYGREHLAYAFHVRQEVIPPPIWQCPHCNQSIRGWAVDTDDNQVLGAT